jgi:alcohol dehydrogenase (NADP+)
MTLAAATCTMPHMPNASAYAALDATSPLGPLTVARREVGPRDVQIEILYCGVCHSDLHTARSEWPGTVYPCVPGHEIIGRVTAVGAEVTRIGVGQMAGVGCLVDACQACASCAEGLEQYCETGMVMTYNSPDAQMPGQMTYGGYSTQITVTERFVLRIPDALDPAAAAPLLCAGITTYSPLRHWQAGPGKKVGIVGLGGLGHMGVKLSHAFGAHTILFTSSASKVADGRRLGADAVVLSTDAEAMLRQAGSFDLIIDTVSVAHDLDAYTSLLKRDATLVLLGAPPVPHPSPNIFNLVFKRRSIAGSLIGGLPETQEMLDFCAAHGIASDIELIPMQGINEAYARMIRNDVKYRFVIDMQSLRG